MRVVKGGKRRTQTEKGIVSYWKRRGSGISLRGEMKETTRSLSLRKSVNKNWNLIAPLSLSLEFIFCKQGLLKRENCSVGALSIGNLGNLLQVLTGIFLFYSLAGKRFPMVFGVLFVRDIRMSPPKTSLSSSKGVFVSLSDP